MTSPLQQRATQGATVTSTHRHTLPRICENTPTQPHKFEPSTTKQKQHIQKAKPTLLPGQGKGKKARNGDVCAICNGPARTQCNMCFTWCCNQCLQESCLRHVSALQPNDRETDMGYTLQPSEHTKEVLALTAAFWTAWQKITEYPLFPLVKLIQESTLAVNDNSLREYITTSHVSINDLLQSSISDDDHLRLSGMLPSDQRRHQELAKLIGHIIQEKALPLKVGRNATSGLLISTKECARKMLHLVAKKRDMLHLVEKGADAMEDTMRPYRSWTPQRQTKATQHILRAYGGSGSCAKGTP